MEIEKKLQKIIHKKESEKKRKVRTLVTMVMVLFIGITIGALLMQNINFSNFSITGFVASGSLPTVGGSTDNWGNILNDYLLQEHTSTGAHGNVTAENLTVEGDVNVTGNLTVGDKITFAFGEVIDNLVDGFITITGGLNVSGVVNSTGLNIDGTVKADNYTDSNDRQIGNLVLIETQTASTADDFINFTTGIDGTYQKYVLEISNLVPTLDAAIRLRVSDDGGSTYEESGYQWAAFRTTANPLTSSAASSSAGYIAISGDWEVGTDVAEAYDATIKFGDVTDTTSHHGFTIDARWMASDAFENRAIISGMLNRGNAINAIQIHTSAGANTIESGTFSLYGVKS